MLGYFLSKNISNILCFLFPAYLTYKSIKYKSMQDEMLRYWTVMGFFSFLEFYADIFVSWLPFYYEVKILFLVWLVLPNSKGPKIVFSQYLKPFLNTREQAIDAALAQTKLRILSQIENAKSQAVRAMASRALSFVEASKNPLLASVIAPLLTNALQAHAMEEQKPADAKIEELPDEVGPSAVAVLEVSHKTDLVCVSPKSSVTSETSSPSSGSPLRDVTNSRKTSPNSSPTGKASLVKPRKSQQNHPISRVTKRGKAVQDLENLQSQPLPSSAVVKKNKAAPTNIRQRQNIGQEN